MIEPSNYPEEEMGGAENYEYDEEGEFGLDAVPEDEYADDGYYDGAAKRSAMRSFDGDHYAAAPEGNSVKFASEHESIEDSQSAEPASAEKPPSNSTEDLEEAAGDLEMFLDAEISKAKKEIKDLGKVELDFI